MEMLWWEILLLSTGEDIDGENEPEKHYNHIDAVLFVKSQTERGNLIAIYYTIIYNGYVCSVCNKWSNEQTLIFYIDTMPTETCAAPHTS